MTIKTMQFLDDNFYLVRVTRYQKICDGYKKTVKETKNYCYFKR